MKKYFGEYCEFLEGEKESAKTYLELWKKFFLRKIQRDSYEVKLLEEQWIERPPEYLSALQLKSSIGLKICVEGEYFYDLEKM